MNIIPLKIILTWTVLMIGTSIAFSAEPVGKLTGSVGVIVGNYETKLNVAFCKDGRACKHLDKNSYFEVYTIEEINRLENDLRQSDSRLNDALNQLATKLGSLEKLVEENHRRVTRAIDNLPVELVRDQAALELIKEMILEEIASSSED